MSDAEHRPETAIPLHLPLWVETQPPDGETEGLRGYALAVGWDRPQSTTFYLVSTPSSERPVWVPEDDIASNSLRSPD